MTVIKPVSNPKRYNYQALVASTTLHANGTFSFHLRHTDAPWGVVYRYKPGSAELETQRNLSDIVTKAWLNDEPVVVVAEGGVDPAESAYVTHHLIRIATGVPIPGWEITASLADLQSLDAPP